jgi:uncharacterized protein (DUF934 family)
MPRQLLRDGRVVADDWTYLDEAGVAQGGATQGDAAQGDAAQGGAAQGGAASAAATQSLILTFDQWLADTPRWRSAPQRLGVILSPAHKVELLAPDLSRFDLVGADFPGPGEGRGYTQARLLRERHGWRGELRATGYVRRDQLFFLARCGFNSFELPEHELHVAAAAFSTFSATYQPSNDAGLELRLRHR